MNKGSISLVFSIFLLAFLMMPSFIAVVDNTVDVSMFYMVYEEEEKNIENSIGSETVFIDLLPIESFFINEKQKHSTKCYYFKKHKKLYLNLISPPPDFS